MPPTMAKFGKKHVLLGYLKELETIGQTDETN